MPKSPYSLFVAAVLLGLAGGAQADGPVAVVEEVGADVTGVALFEVVQSGAVIELGASGRLVLGYLAGCQREEISGGRVTVGKGRSDVQGGRVRRETVECDGGSLQLAAEQVGKSGVQVYRVSEGGGASGEKQPTLTIYGASPIILAIGVSGSATIQRLDVDEQRLSFPLTGGLVDLARLNEHLLPGAIYAARAGDREIIFQIDEYARPGPEPVLSRLIRF